jgi:hypothetical protein
MITLYDLIAKFFCLALEDNIHKISSADNVLDLKTEVRTYKNWSNKLGFHS